MMAVNYDVSEEGRRRSVPISSIIQAANRFGCDIYIRSDENRFNVKNYRELQRGLQLQSRNIVFYFDGADEKEADRGFRILFGVAAYGTE